jgi:hypothetical protein
MYPNEIVAIVKEIRSRPACSLLIFGAGNDSVVWEGANRGGKTVIIESDPRWLEKTKNKLTSASIVRAEYSTFLSEWKLLLNLPQRLRLELPDAVVSHKWDVIIVDGPAGYEEYKKYTGKEAPGRMQSIYMASQLVAPGGIVFVHDSERSVEREYAAHYLGSERVSVTVKGRALLQGYGF